MTKINKYTVSAYFKNILYKNIYSFGHNVHSQ